MAPVMVMPSQQMRVHQMAPAMVTLSQQMPASDGASDDAAQQMPVHQMAPVMAPRMAILMVIPKVAMLMMKAAVVPPILRGALWHSAEWPLCFASLRRRR